MKCINFDERFADFTAKWMKEHRGEYKTYDEMEDDLPRVYTEFLNMPAKWLDGVTPGAYFTQFEDAKDLVDWDGAVLPEGHPVPDMQMEQIQAVGRPCEKRLLTLLRDESDAIPEEARMTAIGLLRDMGSTLPKMLYIQWQLNREMKDDLADNALDSLRDMGKEALQPMLENLNKANEAGQEALLDVLANFPGHENVYQLAVRLFEKNPNRRAPVRKLSGETWRPARAADSHRRRERGKLPLHGLYRAARRHRGAGWRSAGARVLRRPGIRGAAPDGRRGR